jgi:uncharacterized protein YceK
MRMWIIVLVILITFSFIAGCSQIVDSVSKASGAAEKSVGNELENNCNKQCELGIDKEKLAPGCTCTPTPTPTLK